MTPDDPFGAFVDYPFVPVPGAPEGPLRGLTFGVKDLFDVAGYPTGCGHPLKREQSGIAVETASAVQRVLDAGAVFVGKTHTDELAYSLNGENRHYGTPVNPAAPERIPGGSSSGSAVAVAGGLTDFSIGSDTGGSVRIPASYCGIWGMRPTHGAIPLDRAMPFAPSLDSVGWFAREPGLLRDVGACLLPRGKSVPPRRLLLVKEAFEVLPAEALAALAAPISRLRERIAVEEITLAPEGLESWGVTFRVHQGFEIWQTHGAWIEANAPVIGPGICERFAWTSTISLQEFEAAARARAEIRRRVRDACGDDAALLVPSAPGIAPLRGTDTATLEQFRNRALKILCIAGLAGAPQISMPAATLSACPVGLSLVGRPEGDLGLLDLVGTLGAGQP